jgi:hypothetical protein
MPESLWAAAEELAREYGINPTAKAPHREYGKLKILAASAIPEPRPRRSISPNGSSLAPRDSREHCFSIASRALPERCARPPFAPVMDAAIFFIFMHLTAFLGISM